MLTLILPEHPDFGAEVTLHLEHSLVSLSKWEEIHEKPFFTRDVMDEEATLSYLECMLLSEAPPNFRERLTFGEVEIVNKYIHGKKSATWFTEEPNQKPSREVVTTELVYFWMIQFNIPFHPAETWHFNRLMTLIRIAGIKQTKPKPMNKRAQAEYYRELNERRRQELGTSG